MAESPFAARRARLTQRLNGRPALIAAGCAPSRNYAANAYPFRASSHFLYLVGRGIEGSYLLLEGGRATLLRRPPDAADALWHGPSPRREELEEMLGLEVADLDLGTPLPSETATLPAVDRTTREEQSQWLGRAVRYGLPHERDAALADAMIDARLIHDDAAITQLRLAVSATAAAHCAGRAASRPGIREHEVRAAMEHVFMAQGMTTAYPPIVTVHGEVLHCHSYDGELGASDLLLADVGGETAEGWAADITRTWPVSGRSSPTQQAIYDVVLGANQRAIQACQPGTRYREVHRTACVAIAEGLVQLGILRGDPEELVADGAHALFFPHGVGHLLGLDVHDMEDLGDRAGYAPGRTRSPQFGLSYLRLDRDLRPGMAVTIEPGFYQVPAILGDPALQRAAGDRIHKDTLAKFADVRGIRIEDDILIGPEGPENLSSAIPK